MDGDISKWQQTENGGDFMHNLWAKNIVKLATRVGDPDGALIDFVIDNTPRPLREYLQDEYNSWEEFAQAIQAIPVDRLLADRKRREEDNQRDKTITSLQQQLAQLSIQPS